LRWEVWCARWGKVTTRGALCANNVRLQRGIVHRGKGAATFLADQCMGDRVVHVLPVITESGCARGGKGAGSPGAEVALVLLYAPVVAPLVRREGLSLAL
jgi:hypothetical protein